MEGPDEFLVVGAVDVERKLAGVAEYVRQADRTGLAYCAGFVYQGVEQLERPFLGIREIGIEQCRIGMFHGSTIAKIAPVGQVVEKGLKHQRCHVPRPVVIFS